MPYAEVSGCFRGFDESVGPIRVRLANLNSSNVLAVKVNAEGEFSLKGVPAGHYALWATQGIKTIAFKTLHVPLVIQPIVLDLESFSAVPMVQY